MKKTAITFRGAACRCAICQQDDERTCQTHGLVIVPMKMREAIQSTIDLLENAAIPAVKPE